MDRQRNAPTWPRLHPWWTQAWLRGRRGFDRWRLAACATLVALTWLAIRVAATDAGAAAWVHDHRGGLAALVAIALVLGLRLPMVQLAWSLRYGWMAALPLPAQAGRRTLRQAAALLALAVFAWLAVASAGIGLGLGAAAWLRVLASAGLGVAVAGIALAWQADRAWSRPPAPLTRPGTRVPLLTFAWLEHPRLPYVVAWHNRECTRQWRASAGAKPVGLVLLAFPGSPEPYMLFVLLAVVVAIAWYRCVLQSSLAVVARTAPLAQPWPLPAACVAGASLRFPAAAGAIAFAVLFAALVAVQPPPAAAACALLALAAAAPITLARLVARLRSLRQ